MKIIINEIELKRKFNPKELFIQFTTKKRANRIIKDKTLKATPEGIQNFGPSKIYAISTTYGGYYPTVQVTHLNKIKDEGDIIAILFSTPVKPKATFMEETYWDEKEIPIKLHKLITVNQAQNIINKNRKEKIKDYEDYIIYENEKVNEYNVLNIQDSKDGSEGIVYKLGNFIIKRITERSIVKDPVERERLFKLHNFLKNLKHPNIAPVLDMKAKKDEKGNYEYIEILKPKYIPLNYYEKKVMSNFYLIISRSFNSSFLEKAMNNFIFTQEEDYKDNLKKIADAVLFLKNKGVAKYLMTYSNNDPYFDLHEYNVMKKNNGEWIIIDF